MQDNNQFKPYVSANKITPEFTVTSIIMGVILAVVFGAANAYLGLRVGMTVSASIPAAVIAMGVIRVIMRKNSILESNIVQTTGSAGESLAAGAIFTLPALYLWAAEGKMDKPGMLEITLIALLGGLLGVFFMVPLRNALIVKEHGTLPYPEGTACAEVLLAGEEGGSNASTVFAGMGFAAFFKLIIDGLKAVPGEISFRIKGFAGEIGTQIYPAVMSVGYICGPRISSYMFGGGILSWLVLIPVIVLFGETLTLYPGDMPIGEMFAQGGARSHLELIHPLHRRRRTCSRRHHQPYQIASPHYPYIQRCSQRHGRRLKRWLRAHKPEPQHEGCSYRYRNPHSSCMACSCYPRFTYRRCYCCYLRILLCNRFIKNGWSCWQQ